MVNLTSLGLGDFAAGVPTGGRERVMASGACAVRGGLFTGAGRGSIRRYALEGSWTSARLIVRKPFAAIECRVRTYEQKRRTRHRSRHDKPLAAGPRPPASSIDLLEQLLRLCVIGLECEDVIEARQRLGGPGGFPKGLRAQHQLVAKAPTQLGSVTVWIREIVRQLFGDVVDSEAREVLGESISQLACVRISGSGIPRQAHRDDSRQLIRDRGRQ